MIEFALAYGALPSLALSWHHFILMLDGSGRAVARQLLSASPFAEEGYRRQLERYAFE